MNNILLLLVVPAYAHGGPDSWAHDLLPLVFVALPFLKAMWSCWKGD